MRISGWRVDGYGVLADHRIEGLPPGLSIVHGPNEAGKSTLLDFVRGVLFGFPDRRHRRPLHEPLLGGRHGGAIWLRDADERTWLLERYAGARAAVLTGPDGAVAGEGELRQLLGGADAEVFRSVFAFGLGELASLDTLERDEVRELVFSAGVLGAGRSATRAVRSLAERQAAIVRPRQQEALANRLRKRLSELDEALRSQRSAAEQYPAHARACEQLAADAAAAREDAERIRRRLADLERLEACWPVWVRRSEALEALGLLPGPDAAAALLLERAATVSQLAKERSGYEERVERHAGQLAQHAGIERAIAAELASLGTRGELADPLAVEIGIETRTRAAELAQLASEARVLGRTAEEELDRLTGELAARVRERDRTPSTTPGGAAPGPALEARARELQELRQLVLERDQLIAQQTAAEQAERLARLAAAPGRPPHRRAWALGTSLVLLALAVAAAAALGAHGRARAFPVLLGAVAVALLALGAATLRAATRHDDPSAPAAGVTAPAPRHGVDLERISRRIGGLAAGAGLAGAPSPAEVDAALARLEAERADRRRLDELERAVEEATARVGQAQRRVDHRLATIAEAEAEVAALASSLGLPAGIGAETLLAAVASFDRLRELDSARSRLDATTEPLAEAIARYEAEVASLLAELARRGYKVPGAPATPGPGARGAVEHAVEELEHRLDELLAVEAERSGHERAADDCLAELARSLGSGDDAERLRSELELGDVLAWEAERAALRDELAATSARHESLVRATRDAERALEQLEGSTRLAELELERSACEEELASAMEQFAVLGMARSLLEQTLRRYERDRQPAVVARASVLFSSVTDGRYVRLVARADASGGRSHGIEALSAAGTRVDSGDLSRGTAEQLYLCLRLALATSFAGGAVALPLVLDDVLVNFDPLRAAAVARAIAEVATTHQVLAFTCHPHVVELLAGAEPSARVIELPRSR